MFVLIHFLSSSATYEYTDLRDRNEVVHIKSITSEPFTGEFSLFCLGVPSADDSFQYTPQRISQGCLSLRFYQGHLEIKAYGYALEKNRER